MEHCSSEVAVVVDPEFGDRLSTLADQRCVWVAESATNRAAAERLLRGTAAYMVTTFRFNQTAPLPEVFAEILPVVDEHHGILSCNPPYQRIAVYGARPNGTARAALAAIEFELEAETADGFTAIARSTA